MEAQANVSGKGILNFQQGSQQFSLTRHAPSQACSPFIERYWIVRWDLRGQPPYRQVVLTHPNVNLVFEQGLTRVYGITRTSEIRIVEGAGHVLGVKFKPGGFYPFWKQDMSELTETSIDFRDAFGEELGTLEADILAERDDEAMIARAE
ncbi:MAG: AraC family transcriptional regulator, partial [Paenibacillus sp.]|nr:AraC family transcriptional regulator [Paenibacillus sp.]